MLNLLFPFLGKLSADTADNVRAFVRQTRYRALCWLFIGAALFFAVLFACLALFFYLAGVMTQLQAAALLALVWLLAAVIGALCLKIRRSRQASRRNSLISPEQKKLLTGTAMAAAPALLAMGLRPFRKIGMFAVLATGAATAYSLLRGRHKQAGRKPR